MVATAGSRGALSTLITRAPQGRQHPAPATRAAAEIEAALARFRVSAQPRQRLPELEVGTAWRRPLVLDETGHSVRKRTSAMSGRQKCIGINEGPGPQRSEEHTSE